MRTFLLTRTSTVAATAAAVLAVAAPAWAPKYILGASAHGDCVVDGGTTAFQGDFRITSFGVAGDTLVANAIVVGTCTDTAAEVAYTVPGAGYTFPVLSVTGACNESEAVVQVRPGSALVGAFAGTDEKTGEKVKLTLDLARGTLAERSWTTGDPAAVRGKLCAVARLVEHAPVPRLANALNTLVLG
jgi:hypothetical protein